MAEPVNILTPLLMLLQSVLSPPAAPPAQAVDPDAGARRIVECVGRFESGDDYRAVSPSGKYRGRYQMSSDFFVRYGGDPQYAGRHELAPSQMQDEVALRGFKARGLEPWPEARKVCS